jgi:flagellar hook-associated protein 2
MSILTTLGVGSGIDTARLVAELARAERAPREQALSLRRERTQARISALAQVRQGLDAVAGAFRALAEGGELGLRGQSADAATVAVRREGSAAPAALDATIEVLRLASAQTLTSRRYADAGAPVGFGTLTIARGAVTTSGGAVTGFAADPAVAPVTISIGPGNDSLAGVRDAINAAGAGVTASIVNDGLGARLALRGSTGAAGGFTISAVPVPGSPAGLGLADLSFAVGASTLELGSEALNARFRFDGVLVERAGNLVSDLVAGWSFELKRANPGAAVAVSAARDADTQRRALEDFVSVFNDFNTVLRELARPGSAEAEAGPLNAQQAVRALRAELQRLTTRPLGTGSGPASLAEVGLRTGRDGSLSIDQTRLEAALSADPGVLERLFTATQSASSPQVTVRSAIGSTRPGSYALTGLVAATAGRLEGAAAPLAFATALTIDGSNDAVTVALDGRAAVTVALAHGSYASGEAFAAALEAAINADPGLRAAGAAVSVGWDGDALRLVSRTLGSRSAIALSGLEPVLAARLGLDSATATAGTDAAGFIDGVAAIGNGARLTASAASRASGLSVELGASVPASATVTVGEGLAGAFDRLRASLNGSGGSLAEAARRLDREEAALAAEFARLEARSLAFQAGLTRQFGAMDRLVGQYRAVGSFLDLQIQSWFDRRDR